MGTHRRKKAVHALHTNEWPTTVRVLMAHTAQGCANAEFILSMGATLQNQALNFI